MGGRGCNGVYKYGGDAVCAMGLCAEQSFDRKDLGPHGSTCIRGRAYAAGDVHAGGDMCASGDGRASGV